ncbi:MAG: hypothetical protein ACH350_08505 [Parachlamydiaceae bacterium]
MNLLAIFDGQGFDASQKAQKYEDSFVIECRAKFFQIITAILIIYLLFVVVFAAAVVAAAVFVVVSVVVFVVVSVVVVLP